MMSLLFGNSPHAIHKVQGLLEIWKMELAMDVMFPFYDPFRYLVV